MNAQAPCDQSADSRVGLRVGLGEGGELLASRFVEVGEDCADGDVKVAAFFGLPRFGRPRPRIVMTWPFWVFGRMRSFTDPVGVGTGTSPPSSASDKGEPDLG